MDKDKDNSFILSRMFIIKKCENEKEKFYYIHPKKKNRIDSNTTKMNDFTIISFQIISKNRRLVWKQINGISIQTIVNGDSLLSSLNKEYDVYISKLVNRENTIIYSYYDFIDTLC